ncbi:hypothetical protein [Nocardioides sp.]|uniref:hypothetical protein n=1 Tax=Nocardioides sp. TaxID=35761 RepID=UPI002ECFD2F9
MGAVAAVAVLTLTGCGALRPGTAVEVGDERITTSRVDEVTTDFCRAIEPQLEQQAESIQNSFLRSYVAGTLALRTAAEQLAEEHGVEADSEDYLNAVSELRRGLQTVPEEVREAVIEIETASAYVEAVQLAVGEAVLEGGGDDEEIAAAGREEFDAWITKQDVQFDPSLNTEIKDGAFTISDQAVSFAVSERAKAGSAEQPNAVAARQLTIAQRCGR